MGRKTEDELGLEMLVNGRDVGHYRLPVRPLRRNHFVRVQKGRNADGFGSLKGQREIPLLIFVVETVVGNKIRQVGVQNGAEGETVVPAAAEIRYVDSLVSQGLILAPLQQGVALGSSPSGQGAQRVLLVVGIPVTRAFCRFRLIGEYGDRRGVLVDSDLPER